MHTFNNFLELSHVWHIKQTFPKFEKVLDAFVNKAPSGINKTKQNIEIVLNKFDTRVIVLFLPAKKVSKNVV